MTIRRHVDFGGLNSVYSQFEDACDSAPGGVFEQAKIAYVLIGQECDALIQNAKDFGIKTDNCDGIREIELLMFDMLCRENPDIMQEAIYFGGLLEQFPDSRDRIIAGLARDRAFLKDIKGLHDAIVVPTDDPNTDLGADVLGIADTLWADEA
jgi:hypothetical protein